MSADLSFILEVNNEDVAFIKNFDNTQGRNSVIMTRNLHLLAGQVVTLVLSQMDKVWANDGYESWFTGHLIYADI